MVAEVDLRILVDLAIGQARRDLATLEKDFAGALSRIHASKGNIDLISNEDLNRANEFLRKIIQVNSIEDRMEKTRNREVTARSRISTLVQQSGEREEQRQKRMLADAEKAARLGGAKFGFQTQVGNAAIMSDITSAVRGMPTPALTGGLGVFGSSPRLADSNAIIAGMAARAGVAANAVQRITQEGDKAAGAMQRLGTQGKFSIRVLEAFVLYRGFVFLEQSIMGSVRAMMDLDRGVSRVMTQLPNFGQGMRGAITREILDTAKETGLAFDEVADALYQIASAGISGKAAFDALELSAKAAVAGGTNISNAFNSALAQMSAFRLGVEDLDDIYDKQFNLIKRGIFSYEQLTTVVGITADSFYQAGQSLETANAALAAVSETFTGPQLARGATSLRNLVLAVADKPDEFRKLGVETRNANGEIRDLISILEDLDSSLGSLSTGDRAEALKDILPDIRQRQGAVALLGSMDSLKRNYIEQRLALGDLDRAYKVVHGDIRSQTDILKTNIQSGFKPLAGLVGLTFEGINKMDKLMPGFTSNLIGTTAAVTGLAIAWQYLNQTVSMSGANGITQQVSRLTALQGFLKSSAFRYGGAAVIGAGIGGAAGSHGASAGSAIGGILGGAASGAAFGIGGGAPGIAIGAAIGGITSALSYGISAWRDSMAKASQEGGRTFADAFAEALKDNKGELASSLAEAFDASRAVQQRSAVNEFLGQMGANNIGPLTWSPNVPDVAGGTSATRVRPLGAQDRIDPRVVFEASRAAALSAREEFNKPENLAAIEFYVRQQQRAGVAIDQGQFTDAARRQYVENAVTQSFPREAPEAARQFAIQMLDAVDNTEAWNAAFEALVQGDLPAFYDALNNMTDAAVEVARVWELSSNTFEDSLMHAADVIRNGVADSAGYTADELEMLGEEFADLNRVVKKIGLVKELEGIGQFLFDDPNFQLNDLRERLLTDARLGGQGIKDLLNDPEGLLKLVDTLIEFGDVNVDQSTNNNIVVRISGGTDLDTLKAAEVADSIIRELDKAKQAGR